MEKMALKRLYIVPLVLFLSLPITFLITYSIAVENKHVPVWFPYISETGDFPPESCIFSILLNIEAFVMFVCIYVRYLQVYHYPELYPSAPEVNQKINLAGLILGWFSCLGLDLVANFQEMYVMSVHMIGAMMCFGCGTIYFITQAWISYKMPKLASKRLIIIRCVLVAICVVATITTITTGSIAVSKVTGPKPEKKEPWDKTRGGWDWYIASTVSEWVLCVTYSFLICTFVPEFYDLELVAPTVRFRPNVIDSKRQCF